ncbi:MAG: gloB [Gammaproteobacteria bacterium]|jgi:hydroxyacylglutathione hydrolase|nr:gloB [Gammaproteobacteria bacterium]
MKPILTIQAIPAFKDNYIWGVINLRHKTALIIDPGDAKPVLDFLNQYNLRLSAVFITHHHGDHCGGLKDLLKHYSIPVYGPKLEPIVGVSHLVAQPQEIVLPQLELSFKVLDTPGHTKGHIVFYSNEMLFCGDTLFAAGCGRLFEGTAIEMFNSLQKLATLPDNTKIYCAHEYTEPNLKFAQTVEPHNLAIKNKLVTTRQLIARDLITLPSTLAEEKLTNPFLRCHTPEVVHAAQVYANRPLTSQQEVFATIREWKNNFKA